jgi:hypothetical protein
LQSYGPYSIVSIDAVLQIQRILLQLGLFETEFETKFEHTVPVPVFYVDNFKTREGVIDEKKW